MRAGDRAEDGDQHDEDRAGRQRVAEQCQRRIVGQPVRHDAGADDGRDQQRGAERLGGEAPVQIDQPALSRPSAVAADVVRAASASASLSSMSIGRLVKIEMRLFSMR